MTKDFSLFGDDLFGDPIEQTGGGEIKKRFTLPPFSVLNTRDGFWQERKRAWTACGIKSEIGRDAKAITLNDGLQKKYDYLPNIKTGTSIFDPVLCELMCNWFCPPCGQIVDPFAGGSVRGIVAVLLGFKYWGCDLSSKQIEANIEQGEKITPDNLPIWINGDALEETGKAPEADFIFSCPPYGDLEVYSDDPRDISNMEYHTFLAAYKRIILRATQRLRDNRFACFVVGDFRDKKTGNYRGFVGDTVLAFREQGLELYNEAILVNSVGSLPIRITRYFETGRKFGKLHQNVLIFVKGDGKKATRAIVNGEKE